MDLAGQAVIVTGSSSGIGAAIARRLAALGAGIVVNSATSVEAGRRVADELPDAVYVQGDIGDPATAAALIAAAEQRRRDGRRPGQQRGRHHRRAAGRHRRGHGGPLEQGPANERRRDVPGQPGRSPPAAASRGRMDHHHHLARRVRQTGSSLPYAVSKAALDHLTAIMAKHAGAGVRVNAVAPGLVATPWTQDWHERKAGVELAAPLHRVATADDIADAALALIGTRYATGQTLVVDGGLGLVI